jgi:hypothetical protein
MGTAERRETPEEGAAAQVTTRSDAGASGPGAAASGRGPAGGRGAAARESGGSTGGPGGFSGKASYRPLWVEEPARRRRLPDPVRTAAVRAVLLISVTLIQAMVAFLCTLAESWLAFPMAHGHQQCRQYDPGDLGSPGRLGDPSGLESAQRRGVRAQQHRAGPAARAAPRPPSAAGRPAGAGSNTPTGRSRATVAPLRPLPRRDAGPRYAEVAHGAPAGALRNGYRQMVRAEP